MASTSRASSTASPPRRAARTKMASKRAWSRGVRNYMDTHGLLPKGPDAHRRGHPRWSVRHPVVLRARATSSGQTKERLNNPEVTAEARRCGAHVYRGLAEQQRLVGRSHHLAHHSPRGSAKPPRPPARPCSARARSATASTCRASSPTARATILLRLSSSSSRATRQVARPSRGEIARRRPSCRCVARSSTRRKRPSKSCCRTRAAGHRLGPGLRHGRQVRRVAPALRRRIFLLMDADSDGHHISTLLLTFFYRYLPKLIENGRLSGAAAALPHRPRQRDPLGARRRRKDRILARLPKNAKPGSRALGPGRDDAAAAGGRRRSTPSAASR